MIAIGIARIEAHRLEEMIGSQIRHPEKPQTFIKDLVEFDSGDSIHLASTAKNLERLKDLDVKNVWIVGANDKELGKMLKWINPTYLNLYQVLVKDLSIVETLARTETLVLNWNTKATALWDISKNRNLRTLEITDFSRIEDLGPLALAAQLTSLVIGGGIEKLMKIKSLQPLSGLTNLRYLALSNLKVGDDTLAPLGGLISLEELEISNQFETKEYAMLATKLKNTRCRMFQATNPCKIMGTDGKILWDTMVTGRRKPFLLAAKDGDKIEKYKRNFELLKAELKET